MKKEHVCPWWLAYTFDNPLRRIFHNPGRMLGNYVKSGATVMDIGCGLGYFSLGMAKLVGPEGRVIAVDLQEKMLSAVRRRARRGGLEERIQTRRCSPDSIGVTEKVDFVLTFWMAHEVPDTAGFFRQILSCLKPEARLLVAEPAFHVSGQDFRRIMKKAEEAGLSLFESPGIRFSRTALLGLAQ